MTSPSHYLDLAARAAAAAAGDVGTNPMVGCVIVRDGHVLGIGHHRRFGGLHAEREALAACRRLGNDPGGATAYVTLEPCRHHGKQPPCTEALLDAGIAGVVFARRDPHAASGGGAGVLQERGVACALSDASVLATRLSDPFVKRVTTGLPWVIAKWAQTADGYMTTPPGESPWISNAQAIRRVHRLRARVDAVLTGIGTVITDDPGLDARGVRRVRTEAKRIVFAGRRTLPAESQLGRAQRDGAAVLVFRDPGGRVGLASTLRHLAERHGVASVLLECGPTLLDAFFADGLVDEAIVHESPSTGAPGATGRPDAPTVAALASHELVRTRSLGDNTERWYRRPV